MYYRVIYCVPETQNIINQLYFKIFLNLWYKLAIKYIISKPNVINTQTPSLPTYMTTLPTYICSYLWTGGNEHRLYLCGRNSTWLSLTAHPSTFMQRDVRLVA